jgi:hypothetical protein
MKNKLVRILFALSFIAAPLAAHATLYWDEAFQYPNGSVTTNSGGLWVRESGSAAAPGDLLVNHSNLEVAATGGTLISRQDDCDRLFVATNGNAYTNHVVFTVYASFTVICTNLPNGAGSYFASFYNTNNGYCGRIMAFTNGTVLPNTWRLGVTDNIGATNAADGGFPVDLALNTPYQVVEELDPTLSGLRAATIWVNPINLTDTGLTPHETHYTAGDSIGFQSTNEVNSYAFRQGSSFGNAFFVITNLAVATTFAEAVTNVCTTNAVPPVVVYQPVPLTNYIGNPIQLSVVANGQGLGALTYQWMQGGTNYQGGDYGANNSILVVSSAQATDSGDFTLVVSNAYGLSVTSSVAHVFISSSPDAPTFTSQPVSQTIYNGQTVTFSTSVISPDISTVTYQWYTNSVPTGPDAPSLTLNNVSTNITGTVVSVAVNNDVTNTIVVSTNAVLTVLTPQAVSIHYLRTLVDPVTFNPTNTPPSIPYTVTGTVTTFTNLTTGNTASYYLQDGTGGINIFATLGSTFRPAQGDVVTWTGVLSSFTTGLELYADPTGSYPYTSYIDTGATNALPAPVVIPYNFTNAFGFAYVNTNLAGELVTLTNVYFGTNAGLVLSTSANNTVIVTNSGGTKVSLTFFFLDLDTAGKTLPTNAVSVTGPLYGFQPTFSVGVTKWADIVTNPPVSVLIPTNSAKVTGFSLAGGNVVISGTNGQSGGTYYLLASTNMSTSLGQWKVVATNVVTTNGASGAFTFTGTNVAAPSSGNQFYILSNTNSNHP